MKKRLKSYISAIMVVFEHFRIFLKFSKLVTEVNTSRGSGAKILIPLVYWGPTKVVWFQILMALKFLKLGRKVLIVYDELPIPKTLILSFLLMKMVKKIALKLRNNNHLEFVNLENLNKIELLVADKNDAVQAAYVNAQWHLKKAIEINDIEQYESYIGTFEDKAGKIKGIFSNHKIEFCFCPGGIYGTSYLWRKLCARKNVRFASFEGDPGTTLFSPTGAAAHRGDVESKFKNYQGMSLLEKTSFLNLAEEHVLNDIHKRSIHKNRTVNDTWMRTMYKPYDLEIEDFKKSLWGNFESKNILECPTIFLNISWDCAALDLEPNKLSHMRWLVCLLEELISFGSRKISVRQHPDERFYPSMDDYSKIIKDLIHANPNVEIVFYDAYSDISSQDLILKSTSIFTFTSTVGLEGTVLRRPVFCAKENYQTKLNAVFNYKIGETIQNIRNSIVVTDEMYANAVICYYFGQIGAFVVISIGEINHLLSDSNFNRKLEKISRQIMNNDWTYNELEELR